MGKSTILRLAFHLLSAADNRGHRTALYNTPFENLQVTLASGVSLSAMREIGQTTGIIRLTVEKDEAMLATWDYLPERERHAIEDAEEGDIVIGDGTRVVTFKSLIQKVEGDSPTPRGEKAYLSAVKENVPTLFILTADRRLDSDSISDPSDEMELRKVMRYEEPKRINDLVKRSREIALSQALNAASRWISRSVLTSSNQGSVNVHSVYVHVIRNLVSASSLQPRNLPFDTAELLKKIDSIQTRTRELATYGLETPLSMEEFKNALTETQHELAADLLKPYIDSLEGRLDALALIFKIIDRFVSTVNSFLSDKTIEYKLAQGIRIQNRLGVTLEPAHLSSGEQQLLLLFCYVLTAREKPTVFMIDEPEISLNIKWQRQLIQSLLDITEGSSIQFVFASHSMELLAQHRNRVIKLVNLD